MRLTLAGAAGQDKTKQNTNRKPNKLADFYCGTKKTAAPIMCSERKD